MNWSLIILVAVTLAPYEPLDAEEHQRQPHRANNTSEHFRVGLIHFAFKWPWRLVPTKQQKEQISSPGGGTGILGILRPDYHKTQALEMATGRRTNEISPNVIEKPVIAGWNDLTRTLVHPPHQFLRVRRQAEGAQGRLSKGVDENTPPPPPPPPPPTTQAPTTKKTRKPAKKKPGAPPPEITPPPPEGSGPECLVWRNVAPVPTDICKSAAEGRLESPGPEGSHGTNAGENPEYEDDKAEEWSGNSA